MVFLFPKMRRSEHQISDDRALELLSKTTSGTLGTISVTGYPYTVVINHVLYNGKLYFHSAKDGHKITNIKHNDKVSFTTYLGEDIIQDKFTTKYKSVTLFGRAKVIPGNKEVLMELIKKFSPDFFPSGKKYVDKSFDTTVLIEIDIDHITGKERV